MSEQLIETLPMNTLLLVSFLVLVLGIGWMVIRFVLKLAMRVFWLGCLGIVVLGTLLAMAVSIASNQ